MIHRSACGGAVFRIVGAAGLIAFVLGACTAKTQPSPPAKPAPLPPEKLALLWRHPLAEQAALLLSSTAGGTVKLWRGSGESAEGPADLALAEGTEALYVEDNAGAGEGIGTVVAKITMNGQAFHLPNENVLTEERIVRAPNGESVVFHPVSACGDVCHYTIWVLTKAKRRLLTKDTGIFPRVAFSPDASRVVVGSDGLWFIGIGNLDLGERPGFTSPSFAPDGQVFARGIDDDGVYALDVSHAVRRLFAGPKHASEEGDYGADVAEPVTFEDEGRTIAAPLWDNGRRVMLRLDRNGRVLSRKRAERDE